MRMIYNKVNNMSIEIVFIVAFCAWWLVSGYGVLVLIKTSKHVGNDVPSVISILLWPLVLLAASLELGE